MTDYERGFADCKAMAEERCEKMRLGVRREHANHYDACAAAIRALQPSAPSISAERVRDIAINALTTNFHIGTLEIEQAIKDALRESGVRVEGE